MFVCCVCVVCCQVEVSVTSWSLVQRSPTDCGASLCVITKHNPRWAAEPEKQTDAYIGTYMHTYIHVYLFICTTICYVIKTIFLGTQVEGLKKLIIQIEFRHGCCGTQQFTSNWT
jgi:hypothetical protein